MKRLPKLAAASVLMAAAAWPTASFAGDLFTVSVTSSGSSATVGFNTAQQALDQLKSGNLNAILPAYTTSSIANGTIDYRGLQILASYPTAGTRLVFQVPSIGINQSFVGGTRDQSQQQLVDFLKKNGIYGKIMKQLAAVSPVDPVAGNPSSLMSQMVGNDFGAAFATTPSVGNITSASGRANTIGVGLAYGHFSQSSTSVDSMTLPLSYNVNLDSGYTIHFDLPITYVDTNGAKSGAAAFGVGVTIPVTANWTLTPRISAGAVGSLDLAAAAVLTAGSVTSAYRMPIPGDMSVTIGNMAGFAHSIDVTVGSYSVNPNINNGFIKNGAMLAVPAGKFGITGGYLEGTEFQFFLTDTRFFGTKLYEDNHQELGFSFGSPTQTFFGKSLRAGLTYVHAQHSNGVIANLGWRF